MNVRNARLLLLTLLALVILVPGRAQAGKFYYGASYTQSSVDLGVSDIDDGSIVSASVDDTDSGWKAFAGFKLLKFFALEADWIDVGGVSVDGMSDGTGPDYVAGLVNATAEVDGYRLSALGLVPIGKRFTIFARFGFFDWDGTSTITNGGTTISESNSDTDEFYGAGIAWHFKGGSTSLRVEYEMMTLDTTDVEVASAGLAFRF